LWIYDVELGQATVSPLDEPASATPAMLLSGDQAVRDGFEVLESFAAGEIDWVRLVPRLEGTDFSTVLIGFRAGELAGLELVDGLDQVTEIQFGEVEVNPAIPDDAFDFSPPEEVDVIGEPLPRGAAR
ncbi:MAG: outer-membrane lipoprotein carrier protein LolA, partial [Rhodospirillaceae bacterium]|nr:outer-membrane lipoprotein carrier protein LolA [Rhodospirillaceae bacterium]